MKPVRYNDLEKTVVVLQAEQHSYDKTALRGIMVNALFLFFVALLMLNTSVAKSAEGKATLQTQRAVAVNQLEDHNDYYYLASGKKLKLYRKKNTFALRGPHGDKANKVIRRMQANFGDRVSRVNGQGFGNTAVVSVNNEQRTKQKSNKAFDIDGVMLKQLDASITNVDPVFSSGAAKGDVMLLPRLTFELSDVEQLEDILKKYNLTLDRKLKVSANVYNVSLNNAALSADLIFPLVRRLSNEAGVNWAEPQFHFKPIKSAFTPSDTLFAQQWHLRDQGYRGSRCDTDCDADEAWAGPTGSTTGANTVVAVIDDGVELTHPDLDANIYSIPAEIAGNGVDDDGNGYVDDRNGYDFVDDSSPATCVNGATTDDGQLGPDNDPSPRATANCELSAGDIPLDEDNHGTAVAGVIAAENGGAGIGGVGVAFNAKILPVRAFSDFDQSSSSCSTLAEAFEYAAQHADVINASWQMPIPCSTLETALDRVTAGRVTVGVGSKRAASGPVDLGSPVIFASGNDATGWVKVTVPVSAGLHAYEWRYLRGFIPDFNDNNQFVDQTVWLDDIVFSDSSVEGFETISSINAASNEFSSQWVLNSCNADCTSFDGSQPIWDIESDPIRVRTGSSSARIATDGSDCGNSYLHIIKDGPAGNISFWVWVSANTEVDSDKFEFLVDGVERLSYGDLAAFGFKDNEVAYPALLSDDASASIDGIIAVGASDNGDLSGTTTESLLSESRVSYSQYGASLDVVAPGSNQHVGIITTDRTGTDGINTTSSTGDFADTSYTQLFTGTSASAAIVSGVSAAIIAGDNSLSAEDVKQRIRNTADKIGTVAYSSGRNDFHGYGRVNMFRALTGSAASSAVCAPQSFDFSNANDLLRFQTLPQAIAACPAQGPRVPDDSSCFVVKSVSGNTVVFCL